VPHAALHGRIETAVAAALEQHRAELAAIVQRQVEAELERLVDELVADAVARRNGAEENSSPAHGTERDSERAAEENSSPAEELRRCSACSRELPLEAFGVDRSARDGLRRRCGECRRRLEYAPRARIARREKARPAARVGPRDDEEPRPAPGHAENGKTRPSVPRALAAGELERWLVDAGFAERNGRGVVATELGAELAATIFD
jgi:hypothetical protein